MVYVSFLLWALLGFQVQQLQPVPPYGGADSSQTGQKPCTVRGKVLASDTGAPVMRAQITLRRNGSGSSAYSTSTDSSGQYEILNIDPGNYTAAASKSGFLNASLRRGAIVLTNGQEVKDADFLMLRSGAITGTIVDDHDEPIPNVNVQAMMKTYYSGRMQLQARGVSMPTDDRGHYRIHDLPVGRYYVQATKRNGADPSVHYATVLYPGVSRIADAQALKLTGGEEVSSIRLQMHESAVFQVSGRVMDLTTGQPAAGAFVNIGPEDYTAGGSAVNTTAGPDGTFRLTEVTPGSYRLASNMRTANAAQNITAVRIVQVSDRDISNLTITLGPGATIKGRVTAVGADAPSVVRVQLLGRSSNGSTTGGQMATTRPDGSFEIPNVQSGNYEATAFAQAFNNPSGMGQAYFFTSAVNVGNQDVTDSGFTVPEEASSLEVNITLDARSGGITGTTFDADNNPLPNATIALVSADPKKRDSMRYFNRSRSDAKGSFHINAIIPGDYLMVLWPGEGDPGMMADPDVMDALEKFCVRVSVAPSATANQDLRLNSDVQTIVRSLAQN
jgi:protocatechuate 3,4-dioxygenase beta subunit